MKSTLIFATFVLVFGAILFFGCGPTQPSPDDQAKYESVARIIGVGGCATLRDSLKPTEIAQVYAALEIVKEAITSKCNGQPCSPEEFKANIELLLHSQQAFVPLVSAIVAAAEILLPANLSTNAYIAVGVAAATGCQAGLAP